MSAHDRDVENDRWLDETVPTDLGDGNHRAGWLMDTEGHRDILWLHECTGGRRQLGRIDITSGNFHTLVSEEPLHIEPSIKCPLCNDHGSIRNGAWETAA